MDTYKRWPVTIVSGAGSIVVDKSGRSYLDLIGGLAVAGVGHCHPKVVEAVTEQSSKLMHVSNLYSTEPQEALAARLSELTGGYRSFLANSGAEAVECAVKLARRHGGPGRARIIATEGGFHGRTLGALTLTGQPTKQQPFRPLLPEVGHIPYDDAGALQDALDTDVAAVVLEPIQGEAGVRVPSDDYLTIARKLCDEAGALLVLDEVQTGIGRTGRWFAFEDAGVRPDVICLAKALAGGLPIGVCLATPEVAASFRPGDHASTFGGGPVQCAAALAVLEVVEEEGLLERAIIAGEAFRTGLEKIFGSAAIVRGRGLLIGAEFDSELARPIAAAALEKGVLVNDATPHVLRLAPPLVVTDAEVERGLEILREVWHQVGAA